jgi:outer membrane protein assembly factor BamB
MRRPFLLILALLSWSAPAGAALPWSGVPGRPVYDVVRTETQLCNQIRCNALRTGQVAFSGPTSGGDDICTMTEKPAVAPFFLYEGSNYLQTLSSRGELWQFSHRLQLRHRFPNARFPAAHAVALPEGRYLLVNHQEHSLRQSAGTILWRTVFGKPSLWHPPLLVSDRLVVLHGNVKSGTRTGAVLRALAPQNGKVLVEFALPGTYTPRRYAPLAVAHTQTVVVPDAAGGLHAFAAADLAAGKARRLWTVQAGAGEPLSLVGDPGAARVIAAYPPAGRGPNLVAVDLKTGRKTWTQSDPELATSLALHRNMLVYGTRQGGIVILDAASGAVLGRVKPQTNLTPDRDIVVMAVSEPVVDTLGRVYITLGEVPRVLVRAFSGDPGTRLGPLPDSINAEVLGIQLASRKVVYTSSLFQIDHAGSPQLLVGMDTVGLFTSAERLEFCTPEEQGE